MRKLERWLKNIFNPEHDFDMTAIGQALNDPDVRMRWLIDHLEEIRQMNLEVDRRLLDGEDYSMADLCARRKAYKDVLDAILSARRNKPQDLRHNPGSIPLVDLDRVTG